MSDLYRLRLAMDYLGSKLSQRAHPRDDVQVASEPLEIVLEFARAALRDQRLMQHLNEEQGLRRRRDIDRALSEPVPPVVYGVDISHGKDRTVFHVLRHPPTEQAASAPPPAPPVSDATFAALGAAARGAVPPASIGHTKEPGDAA